MTELEGLVIELKQQDGVYLLRMDEGENRFNADSLALWHAHIDEAEKSDGPSALVTIGTGKFYSNGLDLGWLMGGDAGDASPQFFRDLYRLFSRVLTFPGLTVAAINGHAFGAGAQLAMAHDYAVMRSDRGYFCMPELDLKAPLPPPMVAILQTRLPVRTAHEVMVTGRRYSGEDARAAGIVEHAVPEDQVLRKSIELAQPYADKDRATMVELKRGVHRQALAVLAEHS